MVDSPSAVWLALAAAALCGASTVFFVLALRELGTAGTGAYFSTAPFVGATLSTALLGEATLPQFWLAPD